MTKVEKWATAIKLSEKTVDTLIQLGFDSMEALSLLTGDDLQDTYIPQGQRKLLIHAVKATFPDGAVANKNPWANRDNFAKNVLQQLQPNCQNLPLPGMYSWQDPQVYLKL